MTRKLAVGLGAFGLVCLNAFTNAFAAQISPPPTLILPNFDRALVGQIQALEAGAFVARANDSSANWYNPAGLSRAERTSINASSTAYGWTSITANSGGQSIGQTTSTAVPSFFGLVIAAPILQTEKLRAGFSLTQETAWNPSLQEQISSPQGVNTQRLSYSIHDNFGVSLPAFSVGYHPGDRWRFGATLSLMSVNYQNDEYASEQLLSATSQSNQARSAQVGASSVGALLGLGAQYDLSERWRVGLSVRTPSVRLWGSSKINYETLSSVGGQTTDTNFYDDSAFFRYRLPLNANLGIAYETRGFGVEADLRYHSAVGTYTMFSSNLPIVTTSNTGGAPTTSSETLGDIETAFRNVVNFAVGGNYTLSPTVGLHGGFYTSYSPVKNASDPVFRKIDMYGFTFGSSVTVRSVSGSLGAAYEWGSSDPYTVINTLTGVPYETTVKVSTLKLLLALSIGF